MNPLLLPADANVAPCLRWLAAPWNGALADVAFLCKWLLYQLVHSLFHQVDEEKARTENQLSKPIHLRRRIGIGSNNAMMTRKVAPPQGDNDADYDLESPLGPRQPTADLLVKFRKIFDGCCTVVLKVKTGVGWGEV